MKLEKLVGERFKERPADCVIDSHALMTRGGYIKYVASGIYSSYAALRRITRKIEQIIREEMDAIGGQEVLFPVAMPASLLEESGRYSSIGDELLRFADRNGSPMVLGMTHEEAAVQLTREYGQTYAKYPFMIYQIQTKFRDEQRPRGGLIRVREFTMKDAYSFHVSQDDLEDYYARCHRAYERIFARAGIPEAVAVASDSGMMGGSISHEFMLLTPVGEDSIVLCSHCGYKANLEAAECIVVNVASVGQGAEEKAEAGVGAGLESDAVAEAGSQDGAGAGAQAVAQPLEKIHTPGMKTIEDVCAYLGMDVKDSCKAVAYRLASTGGLAVVFLRGDLEINETKLRNYLGDEIGPADLSEGGALAGGFIGPYKFGVGFSQAPAHANALAPTSVPMLLFDNSLKGTANLCCGANELDYHYTGLCISRDIGGDVEYRDFAKVSASGVCVCPRCGKMPPSLTVLRGIEVGNIFQLGQKYTRSMNMRFTDEDGGSRYPYMGCYGIGVGRLAASVCEARHDEYGPIWPMSIAPWQAHICCLRAGDAEVKAASDSLYASLLADGVEVIYDDRDVSAGVMFSDADLLGVPIRVIMSPRNIKEGVCEITARDKSFTHRIALADAPAAISAMVAEMSKA
ncbi:MAG: proline--tRNA ligase [Oscillospiraceae bacterium]|nr:proline--tRNA ligase [Oscillospiraceae bacterium]